VSREASKKGVTEVVSGDVRVKGGVEGWWSNKARAGYSNRCMS
jgi:hypothetical protein